MRKATMLVGMWILSQGVAMAAPKPVKCGGISAQTDDAVWELKKQGQPPLCEMKLVKKADEGYSINFMQLKYSPKEAPMVNKMSSREHLQRMINMMSKGNQGTELQNTAKVGDLEVAETETTNPSGNKGAMTIAMHRGKSQMLFIMIAHEKHRSNGAIPYEEKSFRAEAMEFLKTVSVKD